uniref:Uncharacterized protein n=1 Tax=Anguilla anguilla TaxID=7936 RepID=A0A0E9VRA3_ANGAN
MDEHPPFPRVFLKNGFILSQCQTKTHSCKYSDHTATVKCWMCSVKSNSFVFTLTHRFSKWFLYYRDAGINVPYSVCQ